MEDKDTITLNEKSLEVLVAKFIPTSQYFERSFDSLQRQIDGLRLGQEELKRDMDRRFDQVYAQQTELKRDMDKRFQPSDGQSNRGVYPYASMNDFILKTTGGPMKTPANNQKGFTLIELVVVLVILALLAAVAVPKFFDLQKQAEVASVRGVVGNIRSALSLRTANALVNGEDLETLAGTLYPMDLLSTIPEPYNGRGSSVPTEKGVWYEGASSHDLYYTLNNADIVYSPTTSAYVRYEIEVVQEDLDGDGNDENVGLVFEKYDNDNVIDADIGSNNDADFEWLY
jgi:prepilin-type N-terminal cleavage/methylation domain-containing protein